MSFEVFSVSQFYNKWDQIMPSCWKSLEVFSVSLNNKHFRNSTEE